MSISSSPDHSPVDSFLLDWVRSQGVAVRADGAVRRPHEAFDAPPFSEDDRSSVSRASGFFVQPNLRAARHFRTFLMRDPEWRGKDPETFIRLVEKNLSRISAVGQFVHVTKDDIKEVSPFSPLKGFFLYASGEGEYQVLIKGRVLGRSGSSYENKKTFKEATLFTFGMAEGEEGWVKHQKVVSAFSGIYDRGILNTVEVHKDVFERLGADRGIIAEPLEVMGGYESRPFGELEPSCVVRRTIIIQKEYSGDLYRKMEILSKKRFPLKEVASYGLEIAAMLAKLHRVGYVHRDIKPDNIFLEGERPVLGDLGLTGSRVQRSNFRGVRYTYWPRQMEMEGSRYCDFVDEYGLGFSLAFLLVGRDVFLRENFEWKIGLDARFQRLFCKFVRDRIITKLHKYISDPGVYLEFENVLETLLGKRKFSSSSFFGRIHDFCAGMVLSLENNPEQVMLLEKAKKIAKKMICYHEFSSLMRGIFQTEKIFYQWMIQGKKQMALESPQEGGLPRFDVNDPATRYLVSHIQGANDQICDCCERIVRILS